MPKSVVVATLVILVATVIVTASPFLGGRIPYTKQPNGQKQIETRRTKPTVNGENPCLPCYQGVMCMECADSCEKSGDVCIPKNPCQPCYQGIMCSECADSCERVGPACQPKPFASFGATTDEEADNRSIQEMFIDWEKQHNRTYTPMERALRFGVFTENVKKIHAHNSKKPTPSYTLAVNQFADLTHKEFLAKMHGDSTKRAKFLESQDQTDRIAFDASSVPPTPAPALDWRTKNAVTPIKNQLSCGCDYAFASIATIESANAIKTNKLVSLSEQQILDCSEPQQNEGCQGGGVDNSFNFVLQNEGVTTENEYPYNDVQGECQTGMSTAGTIRAFVDVPAGNEDALLQAVNINPVAVYVDSSNEAFQFYSLGILDDPTCGTSVNHALAVVGYGSDDKGTPYWIIKNSWGTGWGIQGWAMFKRGVNQCGITTRMSYPTV